MVTHNYLLLLTTSKSIYASGVIHWTCRVYFTLLGINSSGVSALGHKPCSVNLALYYYFTNNNKQGRGLSRFNFKTIFINTVNGFHMKITFTHLDTQKTPKTSDSLKPTLNKRSNKSPEFRQISAVITAQPRLGTVYKWWPHNVHKGRARNCWDYIRELLHTL